MIRSSGVFAWKTIFCVSAWLAAATSPALGANARNAVVSAHETPRAEEVAPRDAWWMAEEFAAAREDCETFVGSGGSMEPVYRDRTVLVIQRMEFSRLRPGMTVVFVGGESQMVAHVLVEKTTRGWIAQGAANAARDRILVRERNYVGTVIKAFAPNPAVASVRTPVLPVSSSGPTIAMRGFRPTPDALLALAPARAE